jgi:prefoldin subunit 5
MVARSELLAALADAKARQDEVQCKVAELAWLERQLAQAQEQVKAAREETTTLVAEVHRMVPRADLDSAKELIAHLEAAAAAESRKQREAIASLNLRVESLDAAKSDLEARIQASWNLLHPSLYSY